MNDGVHKVNMRLCKKSKGMRILSLVAGCLLIFSAGSILRAQDQKPRIDEFKKKAQDISREIEKGKAKIQKFSHRETDIISRLNQVDQALNRSRIRIAGLSREIERLEKKITETAAASEKLVDQIKANETYIAKRLVALYKLNWLGKFHVLASAESLQELLQRKTAIERILAYDETVIKALRDNRRDLETVRSRVKFQDRFTFCHCFNKNFWIVRPKRKITIPSPKRRGFINSGNFCINPMRMRVIPVAWAIFAM